MIRWSIIIWSIVTWSIIAWSRNPVNMSMLCYNSFKTEFEHILERFIQYYEDLRSVQVLYNSR